jgi:hypothetical protein
MLTVEIDGETRDISDVSEDWIAGRFRRHEGSAVSCVVIRIQTTGVDLRLASASCSGGVSGTRQPNPREQEIIELWRERNLGASTFAPGNLIAFLKQLRKAI